MHGVGLNQAMHIGVEPIRSHVFIGNFKGPLRAIQTSHTTCTTGQCGYSEPPCVTEGIENYCILHELADDLAVVALIDDSALDDTMAMFDSNSKSRTTSSK